MTNSLNPNRKIRWSSPLDLVRPAFVLLLLVLLPVALLQGRDTDREAQRGAVELHHDSTPQA